MYRQYYLCTLCSSQYVSIPCDCNKSYEWAINCSEEEYQRIVRRENMLDDLVNSNDFKKAQDKIKEEL